MSQQLSNLFLSIGKSVKDEYGRSVGKIISFATDPNGKFEAAYVETSEGRFTKQPIERFTFNGSDITLISEIKSKTAVLCDQIPFIWRKDQALKELTDKKKIASELYQELHNNFSTVLSQLRKDAQISLDDATQGVNRCEEELGILSYSVLHLELQHEIGKIGDEQYKTAFALLQENIKRTTAEKADFETIKSKLSNVLLGDDPKDDRKFEPKIAEPKIPESKMPEQKSQVSVKSEPEADPEAADLPEPPVVVYVKEVGKAGI
jgi:hypothetical protein